MCGITGITYFNKDREVNPATLKDMTDVIAHRGPDDEGFYINQNVGLGFRRLSIIDLSTGHQPLCNEDQSIWIIFNGEIYNYHDLQNDLMKHGHIFKTKSDTETIVHLYEQYGVDCLKYLRGMFAFAIWDNKRQQLFCARDRFGIKPFYFYRDNEKFVFGSEIKAILKCENIDRTLSQEAIDSYFAFGYITSDLSIYKNIKKLQPAHYLLLTFKENGTATTHRYWEIEFNPDFRKSQSQWEEEIRECLSETVKQHMISDVPLGAFLSGGIDSGSVVALMARNSDRPIKTFSIGYKNEAFSELRQARQVAEKYGCEHHEEILEPESISLLPKLVKAYDEPFADSSAVPTYHVSKLARQFVTVALSGDGGDELFAGYNNYRYYENISKSALNFNSDTFNKILWGSIHAVLPDNMKGKFLSYNLSKGKTTSFAYVNMWNEQERNRLIVCKNPKQNFRLASELYKKKILNSIASGDYVTDMQCLDMKTYMVDDILTKVDRASMVHSLEVRVPLLDHKFAELTFRIPRTMKLNGSGQKYIFKQAMARYLPDDHLKLPKKGFGIPISLWFKNDLKEYIEDTLLSGNPLCSEYLNRKYIAKIIGNIKNPKRNLSVKTWSLLVFEEWLKQNSEV
jgi:asparagine synthase (glutamine-hydrolysing)